MNTGLARLFFYLRVSLLLGPTGLGLSAAPVLADDIAWLAAGGGDWHVGTNWVGGVAPGVSDTARIVLDGSYTVTLDSDATVVMLELGGSSGTQTLSSTRVLTLNGPSTINENGLLLLHDDQADIDGIGSLTNNGVVEVVQNPTISVALNTGPGSTIRIGGGSASTLTLSSGFTNEGLIQLTSTSPALATLTVSSGTLENAAGGMIEGLVGAGGGRRLLAELDNLGTVDLGPEAVLSKAGAAHTNEGSINLTAGSLTISQGSNGSFTNNGLIDVVAGELYITQSDGTGVFTNSDTIAVAAGRMVRVFGGSLIQTVPDGAMTGPSGHLYLYTASASFDGGLSTADVGLTANDSRIFGGELTIAPGTTAYLDGTEVNAGINVQGIVTVMCTSNPLAIFSGTVTTDPAGTIHIDGFGANAELQVWSGFTNEGQIQLDSGTSNDAKLCVDGTLVNGASGRIGVFPGAGGDRFLPANIENHGTIDIQTATSMTSCVGSPFLVQADGFLSISDGGLSVGGPLDIQGGVVNGLGGIDADVTNGGEIAPGGFSTIGTFTINGTYEQTSDGSLSIEAEGRNPGEFDVLAVSSEAALAGTLRVDPLPGSGFELAVGDTVEVLTSSSLSGTFEELQQSQCPGETCMDVIYSATLASVIGQEPQASCCLPTGECAMLTEPVCISEGGVWGGLICEPNPCFVPTEPGISAGGRINPEPWHDWISNYDEGGVRIQAHVPGHVGEIDHVEFYYSTDGGSVWEFIDDDLDGYEPPLNTLDEAVQMIGCGWSTFFEIPDSVAAGPIQFKSISYPPEPGDPIENVTQHSYDPAPPSMGAASLEEFVVIDHNALGIEITANGTEIDRVIIHLQDMVPDFSKGIPGISQQVHSASHCAPTAAAQCLKYFEAQGDSVVTSALDDVRLTGGLAAYMSTNQTVSGTLPSNWVGGMGEWIHDYGDAYTVRYYVHYGCDGDTTTWNEDDWRRIRNELERCRDVLLGVFWDGGGGHAITLDSILYPELPDGTIQIGFKDPWTGESETGNLDPLTGHIANMTGAGGGGGGQIGVTMIVSPVESAVDEGGPGEPVYDGLPDTGPPYEIEITVPEPGFWFIHITIVNTSGHASRITNIIEYDPTSSDAPGDVGAMPLAFRLNPAIPNPFHTMTEVSYMLPRQSQVALTIHDLAGRKIRTILDEEAPAGSYTVPWDGRDDQGRRVSSGIYYLRMTTERFEGTRSITLLR